MSLMPRGIFVFLCKKSGHVRENCVQNLAKGNVFATVKGNKTCPLCNSTHPIDIKSSDGTTKNIMGSRLLNCSQFRDAVDHKNRELFLEV